MNRILAGILVVAAIGVGLYFILKGGPQSDTNPVATADTKCYVGGCSGQICSDTPDAVSTCEFQETYACYKDATCERQTDGECGWTMTEGLAMCLGETFTSKD